MSNQNTFNNIIMREIHVIIFPQNDFFFYFKTTHHNSLCCEILCCAKFAPKFPISVVNLNNQKICYDNPGNVPNKGRNFNTQ